MPLPTPLFDILISALWHGAPISAPVPDDVLRELQAQAVDGLALAVLPGRSTEKYAWVAQFVQMASVQTAALRVLADAHIPAVVIKGTATGVYYPVPYLRRYGDIDILVHPDNYRAAIASLAGQGFVQEGDVGADETHLYKDDWLVELHQNPPGLERVQEGADILKYLLAGLDDIQQAEISQPHCRFPVLPWKQHGLELIWHIREHMYNGLGLRQIIDWMLFAHRHLRDAAAFAEFRPVLEMAGLYNLAQTVTRMCQIYLGLPDEFPWCADAEDSLCEELMEFVLEQGNFGVKRSDDKLAKVLTRYHSPLKFLRGMQRFGRENWPAARRHPALRPFAWAYTAAVGARNLFNKEGRARISAGIGESRQRRDLFTRLYGGDAPRVVVTPKPKKQPQPQPRARSLPLKQRVRALYEHVARSPLRAPLYYLENLYFTLRYPLFGKPKISAAERENVERNVTFIYKSFNRQKLAKRCYKVIKRYYPNARVVVADDSAEPLKIPSLAQGDLILHLPFNSGLSQGLIAALAEVKTPYTMRLDDDELLTPASNIHGQLAFLQKHNEVDLVGLQAKHIRPERGAAGYSRIRMNRSLIIPAGTLIDGREVVYKTADLFLVRTASYRKVGYDPNIRMTIHQGFFYRAAGQIICVQDTHAFILHCHNHFAKKNYAKYRADYSGDVAYIAKKHGGGYR